MEVKKTWTAEHLSNGWAIVYDRTPNGKKNEDGSVSYALRLPVLLMSDWLAAPEDTAKDVARELNAFPDLLEALKDCRNAMYADNPADGWAEIISAADAAIAKAEGRS